MALASQRSWCPDGILILSALASWQTQHSDVLGRRTSRMMLALTICMFLSVCLGFTASWEMPALASLLPLRPGGIGVLSPGLHQHPTVSLGTVAILTTLAYWQS